MVFLNLNKRRNHYTMWLGFDVHIKKVLRLRVSLLREDFLRQESAQLICGGGTNVSDTRT